MSDKSAIEWTEATWNPVTGCSKVSPGCAHCYAETLSLRFGRSEQPWTPENAKENVVLHPDRLDQPMRWKRPRMIFVNSMSDLFHEEIPDEFRRRIFDTMYVADHHTYQILTKRPEVARDFLNAYYDRPAADGHSTDPPLPNVWIGVSVENQRWADARIPILLETPAAVRFLSCEPLLGPITFRWRPWAPLINAGHLDSIRGGIDWIIVGGESGPAHRPMEGDWVREIRDQAVEAGVAFFFKQWGGRTPKAGGKVLDGREWCDFPESHAMVVA